MKEIKRLISHDGTFHADDIFATAILKTIFTDINVVRTRDLHDVTESDIVYDVGLEYDGLTRFDHHQNDETLIRENGIPYSSFGLIWRKFGLDYIKKFDYADEADTETLEKVHQKVDESIVQPIDADDNGFFTYFPSEYPTYSLSQVIANYNLDDASSDNQTFRFFKAVSLAKSIMAKQLLRDFNKVKDTIIVHQFIENQDGSDVLELPKYYNWMDAVKGTDIKYVIFKASDGFRVRSVEAKYNFDSNEVELNDNIIFCHKSGFLAGTKTIQSAREFIEKYGK